MNVVLCFLELKADGKGGVVFGIFDIGCRYYYPFVRKYVRLFGLLVGAVHKRKIDEPVAEAET